MCDTNKKVTLEVAADQSKFLEQALLSVFIRRGLIEPGRKDLPMTHPRHCSILCVVVIAGSLHKSEILLSARMWEDLDLQTFCFDVQSIRVFMGL